MGELLGLAQADHSGQSLDRVEVPEEGIELAALQPLRSNFEIEKYPTG